MGGREEVEAEAVASDREARGRGEERTSVSSSIVSIEENRVKIQVPGLPAAKEK